MFKLKLIILLVNRIEYGYSIYFEVQTSKYLIFIKTSNIICDNAPYYTIIDDKRRHEL